MKMWSTNYSWHFGSVKIHKNCLYWKVFSTNIYTYIVKNFSTVFCFFSYICWSVNYMSWVSKFHKFFLTCSETEARFIFEGFKYCPLWKVNFQLSGTFLAFFIWSVNCLRDFFSHFVNQYNVWIESLNHVTYLGDVQKLKH